MYICPVCTAEYPEEGQMIKHFLSCWKEHNPCHQSKSAPRSEDITTRKVNDDIADFFGGSQWMK